MKNFKGKKVVITGGNRGIGQAIALAFAEQGADIIITYNTDQNAADSVIKKILRFGVEAKAIQVNLIDHSDRIRFVKESYTFFSDIDILINNAGALTRNSFLELSREEVTKIFEVNLLAPFFLTQDFAKQMVKQQDRFLKQNSPLKDYCIINITSLSRKVITPGLSHYEASKAALSQLSKSAAVDLARYNIRVNDVAPGLIPTDINRNQWEAHSSIWQKRVKGIPLNRPGMPKEVAKAVLSVADNAWMTGTTITIDGGRTRNWSGTELCENMQPNTELPGAKL